jgi:hypothetical protein
MNPLTKDHTTETGIWYRMGGYGYVDRLIIAESNNEVMETRLLGHECGHVFCNWSDLNDARNLMSQGVGDEIRYMEIEKLYEEGTESQWEEVPR